MSLKGKSECPWSCMFGDEARFQMNIAIAKELNREKNFDHVVENGVHDVVRQVVILTILCEVECSSTCSESQWGQWFDWRQRPHVGRLWPCFGTTIPFAYRIVVVG